MYISKLTAYEYRFYFEENSYREKRWNWTLFYGIDFWERVKKNWPTVTENGLLFISFKCIHVTPIEWRHDQKTKASVSEMKQTSK